MQLGEKDWPGTANINRQGLKLIRDLYHLDNQGKEKQPNERRRYRKEIVKPHLEKIRAWINENQARALSYGTLLAYAFISISDIPISRIL